MRAGDFWLRVLSLLLSYMRAAVFVLAAVLYAGTIASAIVALLHFIDPSISLQRVFTALFLSETSPASGAMFLWGWGIAAFVISTGVWLFEMTSGKTLYAAFLRRMRWQAVAFSFLYAVLIVVSYINPGWFEEGDVLYASRIPILLVIYFVFSLVLVFALGVILSLLDLLLLFARRVQAREAFPKEVSELPWRRNVIDVMMLKMFRRIGALLEDSSLRLLLASNIVTIILAIIQDWDLTTMLWIYWFQGTIIVFFIFLRAKNLFKRAGSSMPLPARRFLMLTSIMQVVAIQGGYFEFLLDPADFIEGTRGPGSSEWQTIIFTAILFFLNHLFSYLYNRPREAPSREMDRYAQIFFLLYPSFRLMPMNISLLGVFFMGSLPLFLILKTIADAASHIVERRFFEQYAGESFPRGIV